MKIRADVSKCVGAGQCVMYAPELFGQDEDSGLVTVVTDDPDAAHHELAERAVLACPSLAIWLEDETGKRIS